MGRQSIDMERGGRAYKLLSSDILLAHGSNADSILKGVAATLGGHRTMRGWITKAGKTMSEWRIGVVTQN